MSGAEYLQLGTITTICLLIFSVFIAFNSVDNGLNSWKKNLLKLEAENPLNGVPRVALGYGACHDLYVRALQVLTFSRDIAEPEHFDEITTELEFMKTFTYFFKHGAASERFVSNAELFDMLVQKAVASPDSRWAIGGNAPIMANRFSREGCSVLLGAKLSHNLLQYMEKNIEVVGREGAEPSVESKEEVHMILEYNAGDKFGPYLTPRANRFIVHNDLDNPVLSALESFGEKLERFKPDLLVISGLQMMEAFVSHNMEQDSDPRKERLNKVVAQIENLPKQTLAHFEMASYVDLGLMLHLADAVLPAVDSLGMNEQELSNVLSVLKSRRISYVADSNPRVAKTLDDMRTLFRLVRQRAEVGNCTRRLSRIHVHTLPFQAILTATQSPWKRTAAAAAKASLVAHRYVCASDDVDVSRSKMLLDESFATSVSESAPRVFLTSEKPVACWEEALAGVPVQFCVAPVVVCTDVKRTVGAGDNISAAGMVLQLL